MPSPGFISDADMLAQIKATLAVDTIDPASAWPLIARRANAAAYSDIRTALFRRGYTLAQIDAWDDGATFQADQGLYWAIVRGGLAKDYDTKYVMLMDRRAELKTAPVTIGGVLVAGSVAATASGAMATAADTFTMADDDLQDWYEVGEGPVPSPVPRW